MFLSYFILAISSSIDSLSIGITYGIKDTKITIFAKIILFITSLLFASMSISIGNFISEFLPAVICNVLSFLILFSMGLWITFQSFNNSSEYKKLQNLRNRKKFINFLLSLLG